MAYDDFEDWYRAEHTRLVNSLFVVSGSVDAARDATDEAFARALERWSRVKTMASPTAWTYRVALNELRRTMRKRAREARRGADPHDQRVQAAEGSDQEVWKAVAQLSLVQREAIVLRYVADLSEHQIGEVLGRRRGTVASDLSRARAALAAVLRERDPEVPRG